MRRIFACLMILVLVRTVAICANEVVGGDRPTVVYAPEDYDEEVPMPLVLLLHGATTDAGWQENYMKFRPLAMSRGFLYACPNGSLSPGGITGWSEGIFGNEFGHTGDDVGYLQSLIEEIDSLFRVDQMRIFVVGHSCGADMAQRMVCEDGKTIAAIAGLAGCFVRDPREVYPVLSPVHILQIHGTQDNVVGYYGGSNMLPALANHVGAVAAAEVWAACNGCSQEAEDAVERLDLIQGIAGAETRVARYVDGCSPGGSVELWTMENGSHVPVLAQQSTPYGQTTKFAVSVVDWLFAHPKRPAPQASFAVEPEVGSAPQEVTVDGRLSTAPEGTDIARYIWDLGDGTRADGATVKHTYAQAGEYVISLAVMTDDNRVSLKTRRSVTVRFDSEPVPPWISEDVGDPAFSGGARLEDDCLQVSGAAGGFIGRVDALHFTHQLISGDFRFTARIVDWRVENARSGFALMMRESLEPGAREGAVMLERRAEGFKHRFLWRISSNSSVRPRSGDTYDHLNLWLRLERRGNVVSGMLSLDNETWTEPETAEVADLPREVHVGLASSYSPSPEGGVASLTTVCDLELVPLPSPRFVRGDCNGDGQTSGTADALFLLSYWFLGTETPSCMAACDVNGDGDTGSVTDAIYALHFNYLGGPAPPEPFPACGPDPTDDALGCVSFAGCE